MKNLRMRKKLLLSFSIVVLLSILVGITGIISLSELSDDAFSIDLIHENALLVQKFQTNLESQRSLYRDAILRVAVNVTDGLEEEIQSIEALAAEAEAMLVTFETSFTQEQSYEILAQIKTSYQEFSLARDVLLADLRGGAGIDTMITHLGTAAAHAANLSEHTEALTSFASRITDEIVDKAEANAAGASGVMLLILLLCVGLSVLLALYISSSISRPTAQLVAAAEKLAIGDVNVDLDIRRRDEIGLLAGTFTNMADSIRQQADILRQVAAGDYSQDIPVRSDKDFMNTAINDMITRSNELIAEIRRSAEEIDDGAAQVAQASENLAAGASQQVASLEEFTSQVSDISKHAEENSNTAASALQLNHKCTTLMQESTDAMNRMVDAMNTISQSSQDIQRIIKVIDDIAFQTNILSLNAAVEAARAGAQGKGFAVVADEVRNLAAKSGEAAQDTAALISNSVHQVHVGEEIVHQVEQCLHNIEQYTTETNQMIHIIDRSSRDQSQSLLEITGNIQQISSVVQSNSSVSEQTATAAQQMAEQSSSLRDTLRIYRTRDGAAHAPAPASPREEIPQDVWTPSPSEELRTGMRLVAEPISKYGM